MDRALPRRKHAQWLPTLPWDMPASAPPVKKYHKHVERVKVWRTAKRSGEQDACTEVCRLWVKRGLAVEALRGPLSVVSPKATFDAAMQRMTRRAQSKHAGYRLAPNRLTGACSLQLGRASARSWPQCLNCRSVTKGHASRSPSLRSLSRWSSCAKHHLSNGKDTAADKSRCDPRIGVLAACPKAANLGRTRLGDIVELPLPSTQLRS